MAKPGCLDLRRTKPRGQKLEGDGLTRVILPAPRVTWWDTADRAEFRKRLAARNTQSWGRFGAMKLYNMGNEL